MMVGAAERWRPRDGIFMPGWLTWERVADETRTRLWPLPMVALVSAIALGIGLPRLDAAIEDDLPVALNDYLFGGGAGAARTVLNAIATSLITVTSLTFSLTVLTLQLASSQYSPRLLRTFARDRFVQGTLALFVGSFVYALTVLRTVRTAEGGRDTFVPQLSVTVAFALTLASVLSLVLFLAHLAREIRIETVLRNVHRDASGSIGRALGECEIMPAGALPPGGKPRNLLAPSSGFVVGVDLEALCEVALEADAVVLVDRRVGDAVVQGTPVARAWSISGGPLSEDRLAGLQERLGQVLHTGFERTSRQDVAFGLRQLTDVATRALSPGINDPTTATHALNHSAALLCDLLQRDLGADVVRDKTGRVRAVVQQRSFAELLDLAVSQPRIYGADDPFVMRALLELLEAVAWVAAGRGQTAAVEGQLARARRVVEEGSLDDGDREDLASIARAVDDALHSGGTASEGGGDIERTP